MDGVFTSDVAKFTMGVAFVMDVGILAVVSG